LILNTNPIIIAISTVYILFSIKDISIDEIPVITFLDACEDGA
jgi:hypothetical protein